MNSEDIKKTIDKKREARIEAKRRKLADQRAQRTEDAVTPDPEDFVYASSEMTEEELARRREERRKRSGTARRNGRKLTTKSKLKIAVIFLLTILLLYGGIQIRDYVSKYTSYRVTDEGFSHAKKFKDAVVLNGIDISEHQDPDINWKKVKTSGVDFVFIRAGYRAANSGKLNEDANFEKNMKGASRAGLMVGAYFYSQALNAEEGREEAHFVLDLVKKYDIELPIVIDYEIYDGGRLDEKIKAGEMYAASFYHDAVLGFCDEVQKAGYEAAVYANKDMLINYMQADLLDDSTTLWLARYDSKAGLAADYWFWQCSDSGKAGGIKENVDQDFWYFEPGKVYPTRAEAKGLKDKNRISIGDCHISMKRESTKIHHFRAVPKYGVTYEGRGLREGRDYIASVVHNTEKGTGYIILRGIGKYKDWIMHPFTIE